VAFRNPDGQLVLIMLNPTDETITTNLRRNYENTSTSLPPHSIATVLF
jgi:O-glycosyl hydrolase